MHGFGVLCSSRVVLPNTPPEAPLTDLALRPSAGEVRITTHAWARIAVMKVSPAQVIDTVENPAVDIPNFNDRMATKGRLTVVYSIDHGKRIVQTVRWSGAETGYEEWEDRFRPEPLLPECPAEPTANGVLLAKLELWGCNEGRRSDDFVHVRTPSGTVVRIRPAAHLKETSPATIDRLCELLGVGAEEFWTRTTKVRPPRERLFAPRPQARRLKAVEVDDPIEQLRALARATPVPKPRPAQSKRGRPRGQASLAVIAYFEDRPGAVHSIEAVADSIGLDQSPVRKACGDLCRDGRLIRVARGRYQLTEEMDEAERRLSEINRELASTEDVLRRAGLVRERIALLTGSSLAGAESEPAPARASTTYDFTDEIDLLFELIAPNGVPDQHADVVARWRRASRNLYELANP